MLSEQPYQPLVTFQGEALPSVLKIEPTLVLYLNRKLLFITIAKHLCFSDTNPVVGTLIQLATDTVITGHVITTLLVDDVTACARECLLYLNCLSVNYEYSPTTSREFPSLGMICELNDETKKDAHFQRRDGYKYYERLNI